MKPMMVKLGNGTSVSINEFTTWSQSKQQNQLRTKEQVKQINRKISEANGRKVQTPQGEFPSMLSASQALGMNRDVLSKMIHNTAIPEYRYVVRREIDSLREFHGTREGKPKPITFTPNGQFTSNRNAIKALKIKAHVFSKLLISNPSEYYVKMSDGSSVPSRATPKKIVRAKKSTVKKIVKTERRTRTDRSVITPKGEFPSMLAAAKGLETTTRKLLRLIYNLDIAEYRFVKEKAKDKSKYFRTALNNVSRRVITPKGEFPTIKQASKTLGISEATLKKLIYDTSKDGFKFAIQLEKDKGKYFDGSVGTKTKALVNTRAVITPKGRFESLSVASQTYGIGVDVLRRYVFNTAYPEFKYEKPEPRDKEKYFHKVIPKAFQKQTVFVRTPKGDFDSIKLAADAYGIEWHQMNRRIASKKFPDFNKVEQNANVKPLIQSKTKKVTVTPLGTFNSKIEAIIAHNISRDEFSKLLRNSQDDYYFLADKK